MDNNHSWQVNSGLLEATATGSNFWRICNAATGESFSLTRIMATGQECMHCSCGVSYEARFRTMHTLCVHMECVEKKIADYWAAKEAVRLHMESGLRRYVEMGGTSGKLSDPYTDEEMGLV